MGGLSVFYPSDQNIASSLGFSDLFNLRDLEERSNNFCQECCDWMEIHKNKIPSALAMKSTEEKKLGQWLRSRRSAKQGKGTFYSSDQEIATTRGYPDLFEIEDLENLSNEMCHKVCGWVKNHENKFPSATSSGEEKKWGIWVSSRRKALCGQGGHFYPSDKVIADSYNCDIFKIENPETKSNEMCRKVCMWVKDHKGSVPSTTSLDVEEKKLGQWVSERRKKRYTFYASDQAIADSFGYQGLFKVRSLEKLNEETCHKMCTWMKAHEGKIPSQKSKDLEERFFGTWLSHRRQAHLGKGKKYNLDPIVSSYGYSDIFVIKSIEELSNEVCHRVCKWIKERGIPSKHSKDLEEKFLGQWIGNKRQSFKMKNKPFYPSDQVIAESYGYPDFFETKKR